jgi:hypothetical protein
MKVTVVTAAVPAAAIPFRASIFLVYVSQVVYNRLVCLVSMRLTRRSLLDRVAHLFATVMDTGNLGVLSSWICKRGLKPCFFLHLRRLLRIFSAPIFNRDLLSVTVRSR